MRTLPTILFHAPEGRHENESEIVAALRDDGYPVEVVREMPRLFERLERVKAPERVIAMADVLSMMAHRADLDGRRRSLRAFYDIMRRPENKRLLYLVLVEPRTEDTDVWCSDGQLVFSSLQVPLEIRMLRRLLGQLYDFVTGRTDVEKVRLKDQFRGCMVGMAVGDALGAWLNTVQIGDRRRAPRPLPPLSKEALREV